jgi:hypothetical protein
LPWQDTTGNSHNKWGYSRNDVNKPLMNLTTQLFGVSLDGDLIRKMVHLVMFWLGLAWKPVALAWLWVALAFMIPRPSQRGWLWPGLA